MTHFEGYISAARAAMDGLDLCEVEGLAAALRDAWSQGRQVFICGNGGSAANAIHIANDLFYGIAKGTGRGIKVHALPANQAIVTCLSNDVAYDAIFSKQIEVLGKEGDVLVALSGSGNSGNIVEALQAARRAGMTTYAVLGYSGGRCLTLAHHAIHVRIDDMQLSEDLQLMVGHMVMQWLAANPPVEKPLTTDLRIVA